MADDPTPGEPLPASDLLPGAFAGKEVVVTGGTSGIGAAVALHFARLGAAVLAVGLEPAGAPPALASAARVAELEVTSADALGELFGEQRDLDVLVNCAGIIRREEEYDEVVFRRVLEVNLVATMRCSTAARSALARRRGCVVNVASMLSFAASPHAPAYGASKAAVAQLTKSLAAAFAADGVRVNAVAPGWVRTPLTARLQGDEAAARQILERTPMGRWGEPGDVVGPVAFLASRDARFVTGVVLPVDGGYSTS